MPFILVWVCGSFSIVPKTQIIFIIFNDRSQFYDDPMVCWFLIATIFVSSINFVSPGWHLSSHHIHPINCPFHCDSISIKLHINWAKLREHANTSTPTIVYYINQHNRRCRVPLIYPQNYLANIRFERGAYVRESNTRLILLQRSWKINHCHSSQVQS